MIQKKTFSQWDKEFQLRLCTIPQHVSMTKDPDAETAEQIIQRQDAFIKLPSPVIEKLSSRETGREIQKIGMFFDLELLQLASIARAVREYYFGKLKLVDLPTYFTKEIPLDSAKAAELSQMVIQKIINDDSQEQEAQAKLEKITLALALKKYPEINEQLVTSSRIKIRSFSEPARPSVKNWLSDYTFTMGFDSHDSAARGTYLFRNDNAKNLSATDKTKLNYILRAFDTNELVEVNLTLRQINFPKAPVSEIAESNFIQKTNPLKTESPKEENTTKPRDIFQKAQDKEKLRSTLPTSNEIVMPKRLSIEPKITPKPGFYGTFTLSKKDLENAPKKQELGAGEHKKILPSALNTIQKSPTIQSTLNSKPSTLISKTPILERKIPEIATTNKPKLEFTSPQKLSFEKQKQETEGKKQTSFAPMTSTAKESDNAPKPIRITPISFKGNVNSNSNNIVDLKE